MTDQGGDSLTEALEPPIRAMIETTNRGDSRALLESFAEGAVLTGFGRAFDDRSISKTPEQRAATSVLLAASLLVTGVGGRHFKGCNEAEIVPEIVDGVHGVRDYALDPAAADRLWEESLRLLKWAIRWGRCRRGTGPRTLRYRVYNSGTPNYLL